MIADDPKSWGKKDQEPTVRENPVSREYIVEYPDKRFGCDLIRIDADMVFVWDHERMRAGYLDAIERCFAYWKAQQQKP